MKFAKLCFSTVLFTWSAVVFSGDLSMFQGTFLQTGGVHDSQSLPCPNSIKVVQSAGSVAIYGLNYGKKKEFLLQKFQESEIDDSDIKVEGAEVNGVAHLASDFGFSSSMTISKISETNYKSVIFITLENSYWSDPLTRDAGHIRCTYDSHVIEKN